MNKSGKAKEITIGGLIILVIAGILFLTESGNDQKGLLGWIGLVFLGVGVLGIIAFFIRMATR
jgi:hypothetical protein